MDLRFENQTHAPQNIHRGGLPKPRISDESIVPLGEEEHPAVEALASQEHMSEAIHRALGLSADRAIKHFRAYNTEHVTRDLRPLEGGEMVVIATIVGQGIEGTLPGSIEVTDDHRGGLDELTITTLGLQAMGAPKAQRMVL